jgi:hypothetical protein
MLFASLVLLAVLISMMFVATAVTSVVNLVRENAAADATTRRRLML